MSGDYERLRQYIIAYGLLVEEIAEAVECLPGNCRAAEILKNAVQDGFNELYPQGWGSEDE